MKIFFINSFELVLRLSIMATLVALIILFIKLFFKEKIGVKGNYFIWLILILRLLMPYTPQSQISFFNIFNHNYTMNKVINYSDIRLSNKSVTKNITEPSNKAIDAKAISSKKSSIANNYIEVAALVWALGVIILVLKMIFSTILFSHKLGFYRRIRDVDILNVLIECKNKVGVKKNIKVYKTNLVKVPGIFGFLKPKLLLPVNLEKRIDKDELRYIILHEISHIKRKDIELSCIVYIIEIIHWFNPVLWYSFYKMKIDREIACDALAMSALEENQSLNYGMTILKVVRRFKSVNTVYGMESFANSKYEIKRRIKMIAKFKKKSYKLSIAALVIFIIVGAITLTNSKNIGLASKKNSPKVAEDKVPTEVKKPKNTNKTVAKSSVVIANNTDKLKSSSTNTTSKSSTAVTASKPKQPSSSNGNQDITTKVKDYILNGQGNLSSAESLNWSKRFLNQVDIDSLYKNYTATGGNSSNVQDFAKYVTLNAPPQSNWKDLFKQDYHDSYGKNIQATKYVYLGNDLYQVYTNENGTEVPYVVVSSKTGYFHG